MFASRREQLFLLHDHNSNFEKKQSMATKTMIWQLKQAGAQSSGDYFAQELLRGVTCTGTGIQPSRRYKSVPQLVPVTPTLDAVAALLVPANCKVEVAVNRIHVPPGLHSLAHADRIDIADHHLFVSVENRIEFDKYDSDCHGSDVFCCITTTRITPDEEIVICPGTPGVKCGKICRSKAWRRLADNNKPQVCPGCSFNPAAPVWQPVIEQPRKTLDALMEMIAGGGISA